MLLNIYSINKSLPEDVIYSMLECERIWDLTPGIYKKSRTLEVNYIRVDDLIFALENNEVQIDKSDIVEMLPDSKMLNAELGMEDDCNYLIKTGLGIERVAIDKEAVFRSISLDEMRNMIYI